jgi:hypothetical protein
MRFTDEISNVSSAVVVRTGSVAIPGERTGEPIGEGHSPEPTRMPRLTSPAYNRAHSANSKEIRLTQP